MTNLLVRLFIGSGGDTEDPEIRGKYGTLAGIVGILCNVLLFAGKLVI